MNYPALSLFRDMMRGILIGYSQGADVEPFLINRLDKSLKNSMGLVALIGPGSVAEFEFHFAKWIGGKPRGGGELARSFPE
jgi:type IV secretory pathway VirJ component